ncbi:hypothetical protein BDM02DRAFT_3125503 [Thelephora ganbajun]|uniref:Uncharacterized protein n=1 Tax=Thelephora ganbajun TaxID=370292 RepID=A0ACB6ZVP8_THEGA|nr:hypothetical protein BDM02DRAFT_3125503 [Thelephora ganbajun]
MELPPPSPSQAPNLTQPTLEADDFVRWGKDLRSNSAGSGAFGGSSGYSSVHVSRTSSSDSSFFPEDLSSEPEDSHSTLRPPRFSSRRLRARVSDPTSESGHSPDSPLLGPGKPGNSSQPKLVEMLKGVSEVLEENTRLKKKRLEKDARRSRLKARTPAKPYDVVPGERVPSTSGKTMRRVSGGSGKETVKPLDPEPMSVDPAPRRSRQNTVSKGKGKEMAKIPAEDSMDVDPPVTLNDISMNEDPLPRGVGRKSKSPPSDSQSSAKMMPPPPVPSKALKQPPKQKSPSKLAPSKMSHPSQPPPSTPPSLTQSNPSRRRTLGMTRTTTQTNAVSHPILPAKRKQFKSPLIKQGPDSSQSGGPPRSQSRMYPIPTSPASSQHTYPTQKPALTESAPKPPKPKKSDPPEVIDISDDPDTSYDFSTSSIDGEELNRAMEKYDRGSW